MTNKCKEFMQRAIELAQDSVDSNAGGPFGAIVARNDEIIGEGCNSVTSTNDPTAHAEIVAIRQACAKLDSFQLEECVIYTSCEPCPMCLGAIYWARPEKLFYACTKADAAQIGFDDQFIYDEISMDIGKRKIETVNFMRQSALSVFESWRNKADKIEY